MRYIHDTKGRAMNLTRKNGAVVHTTTESSVSTSHYVQPDVIRTEWHHPPRGNSMVVISWSHNCETK